MTTSKSYFTNCDRSMVARHIQEIFRMKHVSTTYVFCNYQDTERQTESQLMSSIAKQLMEQLDEIPSELGTFYNEQNKRTKITSLDSWNMLIKSLATCFDRTFVFVDALVSIIYMPTFERAVHALTQDIPGTGRITWIAQRNYLVCSEATWAVRIPVSDFASKCRAFGGVRQSATYLRLCERIGHTELHKRHDEHESKAPPPCQQRRPVDK